MNGLIWFLARRLLIEVNFRIFAPTKATHCTDESEIWHNPNPNRSAPTQRCQYTQQVLQEALLPQTDRATRYFSRNLINLPTCKWSLVICCLINWLFCCTTGETHNKVLVVDVMELKGYSRPRCNNASTVVVFHKLQHWRVLLTTRSTCRGEIF